MCTFILLSCIAATLLVVYIVSTWKYNYWKNRNVLYIKPLPILGNYKEYVFIFKKHLGDISTDICNAFPKAPYVGTFYGTEPALMVKDPDLIKLITTKDFTCFNGREICKYSDSEINSQNVFFDSGDKWKKARSKLTPLFTSSKLKSMFPLIEKCAYMFEDMIDREYSRSRVVEARLLMARYTIDCVCSISFGVEGNVMGEGNVNDNPFKKLGDIIFESSWAQAMRMLCRAIWPYPFYAFGFRLVSKQITDFFGTFLFSEFKEREKNQSARRNDFVDLMLDLKKGNTSLQDLAVDDSFLLAQCIAFFSAGYETSASTLSVTLYELARNQEAQTRAIEEIDEYLLKTGNKFTFDCSNDLPFAMSCINESLRLYPVLFLVTREVMQDYTLPDGVLLTQGLRIHLPVYYLHHSAEHFPEPEKFIPERHMPENKHNIKPYTFMPFGEGPRTCIGQRVAIMQMMPGLITVLKKYRVELADDMPRSLQFNPKCFVSTPIGGIKLKLVLREGWEQRVYPKDK